MNEGILKALEAESIEILRETAAAFKNPVMMYSIGKDSSVLLHLAIKAFYPAPVPFRLLHIDTTWKFKEMITFRDKIVADHKLNLIVHTNQEGVTSGANPFTTGISEYTRIMKTVALRQALDHYEVDAAIGGSRRDEKNLARKNASLAFAILAIVGIHEINALNFGVHTTLVWLLARLCASSHFQIGLKVIFGVTSNKRKLKLIHFTLQKIDRWLSAVTN